MKVTIQYFDIEIDKGGVFVVYDTCYEDGVGVFVPTFGYDKSGTHLSERRRIEENLEYAEIQQEWINKEIDKVIDDFVREAKHNNRNIDEDDELFIAVIKRSDIPNQIGISYSDKEQTIPDFSVKVSEKRAYVEK